MKKGLLIMFLSMALVGCGKQEKTPDIKVSDTSSSTQISSQSSTKDSSTTVKIDESSSTSEEKLEQNSSITTLSKDKYYQRNLIKEINQQFLNWASNRAKIGGMAVTSEFFDHGSAGRGDWYAVTPDGLAMAQDLDNPGYDYFPLHVVGGVTFYYSTNGTLGATDERQQSSFAAGFSEVADVNKPIIKYILCDNGMIYELNSGASLSVGFSEASDEGEISRSQINERAFKTSEDQDAINEFKRILSTINQ
ncbi:hypothetical protein [Vagococcus bubulae]|uniref:Lipoprotein n=1 Tax=Vagococcus bubulae TaxID=1977868 RepID=A0A429ZAV3_9ENTE|nr:hypothetical protein [Vagococcus bubulae]RST90796.1 hypothetical protein CBF36_11070 [Vagococcus bubulae]